MSADELTRRWRTPNGIDVVARGVGETVLMLHGIGGGARTFRALSDLLAREGYGAHAWDAPGYGGSADPGPDGVDHVETVIEVIEELGPEPVHVVGTSWGGTLAVMVARRRPELVRSLVLADSTRGSGVSDGRRRRMLGRVQELESLGSEQFARSRAPGVVAPTCDAETLETARSTMARVRVPGYAAVARMMVETNVGPDLAHLSCPVLVLVGEHDTVTGVDESRLLAHTIPGAQFELVSGAGHSAVLEQPLAVAARLKCFWAQ